jgi:uncharacterized protein (TIGR00251 family)
MSPSRSQLRIKVVPGSSRTRLVGWLGDELKVTIAAVAESGKANAAVIEVIAKVLQVPPRNVSILTGHTRPRKTLEVLGLTPQELMQKLEGAGLTPPNA